MKFKKHEQESMIQPPLNNLLEKIDTRYTLVVAAAKRARQLVDGANRLTDCFSDKPVTVAINEINEDKITYIRTKSGIK